MTPTIKFQKLHPDAIIPEYKTSGAAGMDLHAHTFVWNVSGVLLIGTGIAAEIPEGYEGQIRPRSSLNLKGIHTFLGTIDADFRGELMVAMDLSTHSFNRGDRIAQLVVSPVARCEIRCVDELSCTARATGGWGSTGR